MIMLYYLGCKSPDIEITYWLLLQDFLHQLSGSNQQPWSPINHGETYGKSQQLRKWRFCPPWIILTSSVSRHYRLVEVVGIGRKFDQWSQWSKAWLLSCVTGRLLLPNLTRIPNTPWFFEEFHCVKTPHILCFFAFHCSAPPFYWKEIPC